MFIWVNVFVLNYFLVHVTSWHALKKSFPDGRRTPSELIIANQWVSMTGVFQEYIANSLNCKSNVLHEFCDINITNRSPDTFHNIARVPFHSS